MKRLTGETVIVTSAARGQGAAQARACACEGAHTLAKFGAITLLVNNVGILRLGSLEALSEKDFGDTLSVNVKGAFPGCRAVIPHMRKAGGGSVVNIVSTSGMIGSTSGYGAYAASNGALRMFACCRKKICTSPEPIL